MFKVNDVVFYGTTGICKIIGVEDKVISGTRKSYFVLKPEDGKTQPSISPQEIKRFWQKCVGC